MLSLIASNCSEAYTQALHWVAQFMGTDGTLEFAVSQDFADPRDTHMLEQATRAFVVRALPVDDYLRWMQRFNLVDAEKAVEQFREEVEGGPLYTDFTVPS